MGIVAATGCNSVFGSTYPFNPYLVPWTNSLFENAPAVAAGRPRPLGPGRAPGSASCGSSAATGRCTTSASRRSRGWSPRAPTSTCWCSTRRSTRTPVARRRRRRSAARSRSCRRSVPPSMGGPEARKELGRILMAHGNAYVAQTTPAHLNHFYRSVMEANAYPGPAVVIAYTACMPEHGIADDAASRQAKLAVDSRAFPLFTYDPRRGSTFAERLSLQGNPALRARLGDAAERRAGRLPGVRPIGGPVRCRTSAATASRRPRSRPPRPIALPTGEPSRSSPVSDRPWVRDVPHRARGDRRHRGSGSRRPSRRHGFVEPACCRRRRSASVTA